MSSYTSSVLYRAAFGKVSNDDHFAFFQLIKESSSIASAFDVSDLLPSFKILHPFLSVKNKMLNIRYKLDKVLDKIIDQHMDNLARTKIATGASDNEDIIDVLLRVKDSGELQIPLTKDNIKAVLSVSV